jgi:hypothetical protein
MYFEYTKIDPIMVGDFVNMFVTHIFGAYGPIMFALRFG